MSHATHSALVTVLHSMKVPIWKAQRIEAAVNRANIPDMHSDDLAAELFAWKADAADAAYAEGISDQQGHLFGIPVNGGLAVH